MTNYNDGKWHGWNGGECPVHPDTLINILFDDLSGTGANRTERAGDYSWDGMFAPCAFRVVKEHREPREWWINQTDGVVVLHPTYESADRGRRNSRGDIADAKRNPPIRVREVLE